MGTLRVILALSVIVAHVGPFLGLGFFGGGVMAVETFYVISGFYMALVLSTRYRTHLLEFYFNRFLRLYPAYWIFLTIFLVLSSAYWLFVGHPLGTLSAWADGRNPWFQTWAALSNLGIIGCDWAELYSYVTNTGGLGPNSLIAIQAVWSVSVEIVFYLLAPFVLRLPKSAQVGIFFATVLLRAAIWYGGGGKWTYWMYYFAPAAWPFFMGGVLSYHLMTWLERRGWFALQTQVIGSISLAAIGMIILFYQEFHALRFQDWRYYGLVGLGMPWIFTAFKDSRFDNALAAWSYPLYLGHAVILSLYSPLRHFVPDGQRVYVVVALTVLLSKVVLVLDKRVQLRFKREVSVSGGNSAGQTAVSP